MKLAAFRQLPHDPRPRPRRGSFSGKGRLPSGVPASKLRSAVGAQRRPRRNQAEQCRRIVESPLTDRADLRTAALMRHARKSASYKPALLKALVRCCRQSYDLRIPLGAIGREFTKLYWNQTVVYHLRQAASLSKESTAVKLDSENRPRV